MQKLGSGTDEDLGGLGFVEVMGRENRRTRQIEPAVLSQSMWKGPGRAQLALGERLRSQPVVQRQMETASLGLNVGLSLLHISRHKGCPLRKTFKEGKGCLG